MAPLVRNRITLVWSVLVLVTVLSWIVGAGQSEVGQRNVTVITIAILKARIVALDFMEIRSAPLVLRLFVECWVLAVGGALIAITVT